ncbi:excalibur calcium-binding domain-containing protein [Shewanella chilikensis]|uniref:excalibur calcium-binding domain-containing protein n=1 Tax=Shewanella chilikensis TaxID=558541 RepID=UPI003AF2C774
MGKTLRQLTATADRHSPEHPKQQHPRNGSNLAALRQSLCGNGCQTPRQYCSQMNSRAEAEYFNRYCPNTQMGGDNDGRPCENDSRW